MSIAVQRRATIASAMPRPSAPHSPPDEAEVSAPAARDEVAALARGLAVLRALADAPGPLSNRALADATGIPKATVSRLAATLVTGGFVQQDPDSERFQLGPALLDLSSAYLRNFDMRALCRPYLAELADRAQASVHLGVRDGLDILMIDTVRPRSAVILTRTDIGTRMDIATSACGRAYFGALPATEREALLQDYRREAPQRWKAARDMLLRGAEDVQAHGYGSSFQEWHRDINAIGFTLRGPRGELYALSCGGPAYALSPEALRTEVGPAVLRTQEAIARACGTAAGRGVS